MAIDNVQKVRNHLRGMQPEEKVDALFINPETNEMVNCKVTGVMQDEVGNDKDGWTKTLTFVVKPS